MVVFGRETKAGPMGHSAGLRGGVGSTFSHEQWICPTMLGQCERLPRARTVREKHTSGVQGPAQESYVVCVSGFPCRVYINSNHRDYQM
jgi:hypothetical protein